MQLAMRAAVQETGINKWATCYTFHHSFAKYLLEKTQDIRMIQVLLCHKDVRTIMIYTHVLNRGSQAIGSPTDVL